jgi:hypothetical protein
MKKLIFLLLVIAILVGVGMANLGERRVYPLRPGIKYLFTGSRDPNNFWDDVNNVYTLNGLLEVLDVNVAGDLDVNDVNVVGELILAALTEGSILFVDANGTVIEDNANFLYNNATDTLTIENLDVNGVSVFGAGDNKTTISAAGDFSFEGHAGLGFGSMYIPGIDLVVSIGDANPTEVKDDGTTSLNDGWKPGALNDVTFPSGGDEHYLIVDKIGVYSGNWEMSAHTATGGASVLHGGIMIDDVAQRNDGEGHTHVSNSNDDQSFGGPVMIRCPNGNEEISLWVSDDNSRDIHIEHANLTIMLVAGPYITVDRMIYENGDVMLYENGDIMIYD